MVGVSGLLGVAGLIGATLHAHAMPIPALGQAAYMALFHTAPLLYLSLRSPHFLHTLAGVGFTTGTFLFTGSIYLKYLGGWAGATAVAPAGGILLLLSWVVVAIGAFWRKGVS